MNALQPQAGPTVAHPALSGASAVLQIALALLLASVVLYGVGFAHSPSAHNAAHDVRHGAALPCH